MRFPRRSSAGKSPRGTSRLHRLGRRVALGAASAALVVTGTFLLAAPPASAAASPQWRVRLLGQPTNFSASTEDSYLIVLTNVGTAPTVKSNNITITDSLPPGLTATRVKLSLTGVEDAGPTLCTTAPVQCVYPKGNLSLPQIKPGESLDMIVYVAVEPSLPAGTVLTDSVAVSGGGAPNASATTSSNRVDPAPAAFGFQDFELAAQSAAAAPYTQAGGHPYQLTVGGSFNSKPDPIREGSPEGPLYFPLEEAKDITVDLPPGMIGNPQATKKCQLAEFYTAECPAASQVGTIFLVPPYTIHSAISGFYTGVPLYNLEPQPGHAATLGYLIVRSVPFILNAGVRSGGDYSVVTTAQDTPGVLLTVFSTTLWGVPADPSHNAERGQECQPVFGCNGGGLSSGETPRPFLTMPTECPAASLHAGVSANTWENPGVFQSADASMPAADGCAGVSFEPSLQARPTTNLPDSPSGLEVDLHVHQEEEPEPEGVSPSDLRNATVTLPAGIKVNPASAAGLGGCSLAQIGYKPGTSAPLEFTPGAAACPTASKLGKVEIDTPLLDHPLPGAVYLANPHENPFGSLLALYIVIEDPISGVIVKLAGKVTPDPVTGQLSASFEENPQVPFEDFHLHFFGGAQGALRTPAICGTYTTTSVLTPYSAPESGPPATPSDSFAIGGPCSHSAGEEPNAPRFHVGTESPQAGAFSRLGLKLVREDGSQELKGLEATLPPGLVGKLAGVAECSDAQIAAAEQKSGQAEKASPSCPAASEVGTVDVGAGAGPDPYYVQGKAYLAGPYKGAPLSLAIITPAVAGPFDLGDVVVRSALLVNPETAQITAKSDPIPTILQGIPLDVRSVTVKTSRPNFTLNPTSCNELSFTGSALSALNAAAPLSQRFQAAGCSALPFKPQLALRLKGGTKRNDNPAFTATLTMPPGGANIAKAQVTLPHSAFLDQAHIGTVCTRVQFAEGSAPGEKCPAASIYGQAKAITPLLDNPLEGPVYLRSSSNKLPDLVAALNGQIAVALDGKVDTGKGGGIRNTFEVVPDAPVSKFTLSMFGGNKGLIVNSENICGKKAKTHAIVDFTAQNGKLSETTPAIANSCKKHKKGKHHKRGARRHPRAAG